MNKILITGMKFLANVGHYNNEKLAGTNISIDVVLQTKTSETEFSDDIKNVVNYQHVYCLIKQIIINNSFNLLEKMADEIIKNLFKNFNEIEKIKIRIIKTNPQMGGEIDFVGIKIKSVRSKYFKN